MKILIASSEVVPYVKTGGLADVTGTLVNALSKLGTKASIILPLYRKVKTELNVWDIQPMPHEITVPLGNNIETGRLWNAKTSKGSDVFFIENDRFFDRDELYGTSEGDYSDNAMRFIFYCRGVLEAIKVLDLEVDIIHCNDWQTGLIPVYLKTIYKDTFPHIRTLLTLHNLGYQGIFWHLDMDITGLGWDMFNIKALEFYGKINLLKGGLIFADSITTVSTTYAKEIQTPEHGFGLEDVLKKRRKNLYGIINGIDVNEWGPWKDNLIPTKYNRKNLSGKADCKRSLQKECGLTVNDSPLIGMVTRLSSQKGLDLVSEAIVDLINSGSQVVILGKGDDYYQTLFSNLHSRYSGKLSVTIGYDNNFAHRIYAGSDIFLMPSKYEPCGLGQLIALRYGAIPVGRKTGGFADSITEYNNSSGSGTGFLFEDYSKDAMIKAIEKALKFYNDRDRWANIVRNAMSQDFSWNHSAKEYIAIYKKTLSENKGKSS
jgi:starch synthase